jgi:hypothetical protein
MKSKLRKVHIGDVEWSYVIDSPELRIYEPKTKQIKVRVNTSKSDGWLIEENEFDGWRYNYRPNVIKKYINDNLLS